MSLALRRCDVVTARVGVARLHRHLARRQPKQAMVAFEVVHPTGWPAGWALVGRPASRVLQRRGWVEVTRVATDGARNACSMLYGAAARWARERGLPIHTYTLDSEPGTSLRAAGWIAIGRTPPKRWGHKKRPRAGHAVEGAGKVRWCPVSCIHLFFWPWLVAMPARPAMLEAA